MTVLVVFLFRMTTLIQVEPKKYCIVCKLSEVEVISHDVCFTCYSKSTFDPEERLVVENENDDIQ